MITQDYNGKVNSSKALFITSQNERKQFALYVEQKGLFVQPSELILATTGFSFLTRFDFHGIATHTVTAVKTYQQHITGIAMFYNVLFEGYPAIFSLHCLQAYAQAPCCTPHFAKKANQIFNPSILHL